jgi:hypothetical protein
MVEADRAGMHAATQHWFAFVSQETYDIRLSSIAIIL